MHPATCIAVVVVLAVFLARGTWAQLATAGAFLVLWGAFVRPDFHGCARALWRLRVFYLVVPVIHLLAYGQAGLHAALRDVAGLALMVLTVVVVLKPADPRALLEGLTWWLRPLGRVGLPAERFALCVGLTLQWVPWAQAALARCTGRPGRRLVRLARTLVSTSPPIPRLVIGEEQNIREPPPWQWVTPFLLLVLLWLAGDFPVPGFTPR